MSENEKPSDLALIGAGYWGKNLARNFHQLGVLRLLCDADDEALGRFFTGTYAGDYEAELFAEFDASLPEHPNW